MPKKTRSKARPKKKALSSSISKIEGSYRHGHLRDALIRAALQLINVRQDVSFTIRELAQMTGVSHSAAYRHFKSKREILIAIAINGFQMLQQSFDAALSGREESIEKSSLLVLGEAYVNFARTNPHYFRVMFHPEIKNVDDNLLLIEASKGTFGALVESISENQRRGRFIEAPPLELAMFAWSIVHGMSTLYLNNNFKGPLSFALADPRHYIQRLAQLTETGLLNEKFKGMSRP